jgi:hypothetical protein
MCSEFKTGDNICTCRKHPGFKDEPKSFPLLKISEFKAVKTYQEPIFTPYILSGNPGSALAERRHAPRRDK